MVLLPYWPPGLSPRWLPYYPVFLHSVQDEYGGLCAPWVTPPAVAVE